MKQTQNQDKLNVRKIISLLTLLFVWQFQAQETNKLKIKSIDYGAIGIYTNLDKNGARGYCSNIELVSNYQRSLYSVNYTLGFGITEKDNKIHDLQGFMSVDALYGRIIKVSRTIVFEPYLGLGYIIQSNTADAGGKSAIGFPIRAKFLFQASKKFAIGLNPNATVNNVHTIYSANVILRFGFLN
ncbi:hypothetical protein [Flavobacterium restrictum]|uniref:Outer membrane protein beta-barrel domain-containing protein n=1 Tax=Flavobacterium restrictum TaxID=2594428 RepID=A0A553E2X8_9FLAO|nr:hypothetical protein [Flavobacterium restrictum]TRX39397.1 hypothetical protein FNW21_08875 [Flavobacterium restrictum]